MSYARQNQPQSKLESHSSDWKSLQLWSPNDSSSKLTCLIEREALPTNTNVRSRAIESSTKPLLWLTLGLTLGLILYGSGLITLSNSIHSLTQQVVTEWVRHYRTLEQI